MGPPRWIGIAAGLCVLIVAAPVLAHPKLVKSQPAKGASLSKAPTKIQLWFHEELATRGSSFSVLNQKHERVDSADAQVNLDDRRMIEGSVKPLPPGLYRVRWKAVADDDRAVTEGSFPFRIRK